MTWSCKAIHETWTQLHIASLTAQLVLLNEHVHASIVREPKPKDLWHWTTSCEFIIPINVDIEILTYSPERPAKLDGPPEQCYETTPARFDFALHPYVIEDGQKIFLPNFRIEAGEVDPSSEATLLSAFEDYMHGDTER